MYEITITIAGETGSGKSTLLWEINRALLKAGVKANLQLEIGNDRVPDDMLLGKRLDVIAERVRRGTLLLTLKEISVNKAKDFAAGGSLFGDRNSLQDAQGAGSLYNLQTAFSQRKKVSSAMFELVSVQPMSLPSGLLFYLDYRYDSVKAGQRRAHEDDVPDRTDRA